MPPAVALAIPAIAGAAGSASSGKKGANAANAAANKQFQMQQQAFNTGMSAWQPAANYYQALLSGDPTQIAAAVGPTTDILKQQGQANARQLAATSPMGGEANAAQLANTNNTYNQIARTYAGVQPAAAQALGQLSSVPLGISAPNAGSGLKYNTHQQDQSSANKGGIGQGLGTILAGGGKGGGKNPSFGNIGTPSTFPSPGPTLAPNINLPGTSQPGSLGGLF
jgi:hypothetical protein